VARQLRKKHFRARTVTLKIKHADFSQVTRQAPLSRPSQSARPIYAAAKKLLEKYQLKQDVRLIGVGTSGLLPAAAPVQMALFRETAVTDGDWEKVDRTVDEITHRFGKGIIGRAESKPNG
jgi:DNA polymerase-4